MLCPACGNELTEMETGGVSVDACQGGCGGIWFDRFELEKLDEPHESEGVAILDIEKKASIYIDHRRRRKCPNCVNVVMMRHFSSIKRQVEVDECPQCGGFWLDAGELAAIRKEFGTHEEKTKATEAYFGKLFDKRAYAVAGQSQNPARSAQSVGRLLAFLRPI